MNQYNDIIQPNILIIVGNGFDLYHGLQTKYVDFYSWLKRNNYDDFISNMEEIYPSVTSTTLNLWHDFETAIGEYDLSILYSLFGENDPAIVQDAELCAKNRFQPLISQIRPLIREWIRSVDLTKIEPKLPLPNNALYITFNYTLTLEQVYAIPPSQILHIHNSIKDDYIIAGTDRLENRWSLEKENLRYEEEYYKKGVVEVFNLLYKEFDKQLRTHSKFFDCLNAINNVFILGHSLSVIDQRYFGEIANKVGKAQWYVSKHSDEDDVRFEDFRQRMIKVADSRWHSFKL